MSLQNKYGMKQSWIGLPYTDMKIISILHKTNIVRMLDWFEYDAV